MNSLLENTREKGRFFKTNYFKVVVILQKGLATNLANYKNEEMLLGFFHRLLKILDEQ